MDCGEAFQKWMGIFRFLLLCRSPALPQISGDRAARKKRKDDEFLELMARTDEENDSSLGATIVRLRAERREEDARRCDWWVARRKFAVLCRLQAAFVRAGAVRARARPRGGLVLRRGRVLADERRLSAPP